MGRLLRDGEVDVENGQFKWWNIMSFNYIIRKNLEVLRNRIKLSEFIDILMDNLYKIIPSNLVKPVHDILNDLIDEIIFL